MSIAFVQQNGVWPAANATSVTLTFPSTTTLHSLLIVQMQSANNPTWTVSDTAGNSWTRINGAALAAGFGDLNVWWAVNTAATSSHQVTVSGGSTTINAPNMQILEFTGLASTSPFDSVVTTTGTSNAPNENITLSGSDGLVIAFCIPSATDYANAGVAWVSTDGSNFNRNAAIYQPLSNQTANALFKQVNSSGSLVSAAWGIMTTSWKPPFGAGAIPSTLDITGTILAPKGTAGIPVLTDSRDLIFRPNIGGPAMNTGLTSSPGTGQIFPTGRY